jgi:hypothetical protein
MANLCKQFKDQVALSMTFSCPVSEKTTFYLIDSVTDACGLAQAGHAYLKPRGMLRGI